MKLRLVIVSGFFLFIAMILMLSSHPKPDLVRMSGPVKHSKQSSQIQDVTAKAVSRVNLQGRNSSKVATSSLHQGFAELSIDTFMTNPSFGDLKAKLDRMKIPYQEKRLGHDRSGWRWEIVAHSESHRLKTLVAGYSQTSNGEIQFNFLRYAIDVEDGDIDGLRDHMITGVDDRMSQTRNSPTLLRWENQESRKSLWAQFSQAEGQSIAWITTEYMHP